jgi:hypothetical protein
LRIFNRLIISLVIVFSLINAFLAFLGQDDISTYFITNAFAYLMITLLFVHLNPRARGALSGVSTVIFASFMVVVALKVIEILK